MPPAPQGDGASPLRDQRRPARDPALRPTRGGMDDHGSLGTSKIKF